MKALWKAAGPGAILALAVLHGGCSAPHRGDPPALSPIAARSTKAPPMAPPQPLPPAPPGANADILAAPPKEPAEPSPLPGAAGAVAADLAAARLVGNMRAAIDEFAPGRRETVRIEAWRLRNFSHAAPREFATMRRRLCELLSAAGAGANPRIEFVDAQESPVDFELHGTAYLLTAAGFDQWELYLSLRPARDRWTVWEGAAPVRMLRNQRQVDGLLP